MAGTHNENSCRVLADLLNEKKVSHNHPHVYFSQLLGMSDNLSFNLADAGYNVLNMSLRARESGFALLVQPCAGKYGYCRTNEPGAEPDHQREKAEETLSI